MDADCHIHMVLDSLDWRAAIRRHRDGPDLPFIRRTLETYRRQGFTYLRDGGDRWGVGAAARSLAGEYGIVYRTPLSPLHRAGHYGGFIGTAYSSLSEYARLVRDIREDGGDFLKIMVSGLMDFDRFGVLSEPSLDPAEIKELVRIGRSEGLAVMVHGNGARAVEAAAEAGAASIEHGAYLDGDALAAMAEMGTVWVPTLSTIGNLRGTPRSSPAAEKILDSALENVAAFAAMGGLIAPGSDAGAYGVPHGCRTEEKLLSLALGGQTQAVLSQGIRRIREMF